MWVGNQKKYGEYGNQNTLVILAVQSKVIRSGLEKVGYLKAWTPGTCAFAFAVAFAFAFAKPAVCDLIKSTRICGRRCRKKIFEA